MKALPPTWFNLLVLNLFLLSLVTTRAAIGISFQGTHPIHTDEVQMNGPVSVIIDPPSVGGIYYSLNGEDPTFASTPYSPGFVISGNGVHDLRVVRYNADLTAERRRLVIHIGRAFSLHTPSNAAVLMTVTPPVAQPWNGMILSNSVVKFVPERTFGMTFKEWRGSYPTTNQILEFTMRSNVAVKPIFQTPIFLATQGPGSVRIFPEKPQYEYGELVSLHADPAPGSFFVGWNYPAGGDQIHSIKDPELFTVFPLRTAINAVFKTAGEGQVTLDTDAPGLTATITPNPARYVFFPGETVTVSAELLDSAFYGWDNHPELGLNLSASIAISENSKLSLLTERLLKWQATLGQAGFPAVSRTGEIYVSSGNGLFCLGPDGIERWLARIFDPAPSSIQIPPKLQNPVIGPSGGIYAASTYPRFYAFNRAGEVRWEVTGTNWPPSMAAVDSAENLYLTMDGALKSYSMDGEPRWSATAPSPLVGSPVVTPNGIVVVQSADNRPFAFDADSGEFKWSGSSLGGPVEFVLNQEGDLILPGRSINDDGDINWVMPPGVTLGSVLGVDTTGAFYMFQGTVITKFSSTGEPGWSSSPGHKGLTLDAADFVYMGSPQLTEWFSPAGTLLAQGLINQIAWQSATMGHDNTLYLTLHSSTLKAFRALNGPAPNSWSAYRGNPQRTGSYIPAEVDLAPSLPILEDRATTNNGTFELVLVVTDDISSPEELTVTAGSDNPGVAPDENIVITREGNLWRINISPVAGSAGTARITITARDANGNTSVRQFNLIVDPPQLPELIVNLVPAITLAGKVGERYRIEFRPKVEGGTWTALTTVTLTNEVQDVYIDLSARGGGDRYYRAVLE